MFRAVLIEKHDGEYRSSLQTIDDARLPPGDVSVRVAFSTLNYKDALALTGKGPVVRQFPMIPGIDFSGVVEETSNSDYKVGDRVVLNGWGVGENHWGGLAERARVRGEWLVPLEPGFTLRDAMGIGTAGYTAMLCVLALEKHGVTPGSGEVLVTGATGGVGSVAVAIMAKLGYDVVAVTGRPTEAGFLKALGAKEVLDRASFDKPGKPLARERWAGAVDVAGGQILANVCAAMKYRGTVAACGLAGGMELSTTVAPFILRGVTLAGIDSVMCPKQERLDAWRRLARDFDPVILSGIVEHVELSDVTQAGGRLINGQVRGRIVVPITPELN